MNWKHYTTGQAAYDVWVLSHGPYVLARVEQWSKPINGGGGMCRYVSTEDKDKSSKFWMVEVLDRGTGETFETVEQAQKSAVLKLEVLARFIIETGMQPAV